MSRIPQPPIDPPEPKPKPPDDRVFDKGSDDEPYRWNPVTGDCNEREYRDH